MATIEDLDNKSFTNMTSDEAIELLRTIRLSRRVPVKKTTKTITKKSKKQKAPEVTAEQAAELLKLLQK